MVCPCTHVCLKYVCTVHDKRILNITLSAYGQYHKDKRSFFLYQDGYNLKNDWIVNLKVEVKYRSVGLEYTSFTLALIVHSIEICNTTHTLTTV